MKRIATCILISLCGFIGMWLLQWREWLEGEPIKAGGTCGDEDE